MDAVDPALRELLVCPRCAGALVSAGKILQCRACQIDFPTLGGVPCLMPDPKRALMDWQRDLQRMVELVERQVGSFDSELKRTDLLASTRGRLERLRNGYRDNGNAIIDLFRAAGLAPDSRAKASEREHSLIQYYEQALRDWAWDAEGYGENKLAADLVTATLGEQRDVGRVLVLGAGACRLAYDLHQRLAPGMTVCLDFDPLLLLIARRMLDGDRLTFTEFPSDSPSLAGICVEHQLAAPPGRREDFYLLAADAFAAPLRPGAFDTVLTPWFIDIVPVDLRNTISVIHGLLAPGGRWLNYGPLSYPMEQHHGARYSPDELIELAGKAGFALPGLERTVIDYMRSHANRRWKTVEVFTFAARKQAPDEAPVASSPGDAPAWLVFSHLPIPRFAGLAGYVPDHPMLAYLAKLIDGTRTLGDLAARVVADHGARPEAALDGTRAMMALMYKAASGGATS
jgi:uncharacterized protein YbaR (Trm112 family)/SAM-dependent methyltransferase